MDWKALYLTSTGRLGQRDFWIAWLILFAAGLVASMVPLLGRLVLLALVFPNVCITAKRLHDFGRSGWLAALPYVAGAVVGVAGMILGGAALMAGLAGHGVGSLAMTGVMGVMALLSLVMLAAGLGFLLWVGLGRPDPQPNAYGPPPAAVFGAGATPTAI